MITTVLAASGASADGNWSLEHLKAQVESSLREVRLDLGAMGFELHLGRTSSTALSVALYRDGVARRGRILDPCPSQLSTAVAEVRAVVVRFLGAGPSSRVEVVPSRLLGEEATRSPALSALVGLTLGFGLGHAVGGVYDRGGFVFTILETLELAGLFFSWAQCTDEALVGEYPGGLNYRVPYRYCPRGAEAGMAAFGVASLVTRLIESIAAFASTAAENEVVRSGILVSAGPVGSGGAISATVRF
ncbi:MAG: hypothetical protein IT384_33255 [Deltaproteobacteria bacterium]|nr:hypothetical protein [Deltaproteobacteria bacterium]